jgi:hypothetical protein
MKIDTECILRNGNPFPCRIAAVDRERVISESLFPEEISLCYKRFTMMNSLFFGGVLPLPELKIVNPDGFCACAGILVKENLQIPVIKFSVTLFTINQKSDLRHDVLLHELCHLYLTLFWLNDRRNVHGANFKRTCNRISALCGWPEVSQRRPAGYWPMNCRTSRDYIKNYVEFSIRHEEIENQLQQERQSKQARQLSDQAADLIHDLYENGQDQTAERVRDVIFNERLSLLTERFTT